MSLLSDAIVQRLGALRRKIVGSPRQASRARHWDVLVMCSLAILISALLVVSDDGTSVALGALPERRLPPSCLSKQLFGVSCPGCGLTRSFVCLAHGQVRQSFAYHRLGWLLFLVFALQIPYRIAALRRPGLPQPTALWTTVPYYASHALVILLFANWILSIFIGGDPP